VNKIYSWSMRNGSRILFWAAIFGFFATLWGQFVVLAKSFGKMASDHYSESLPYFSLESFLTALGSALITFGFLFLAALVIDRIDKRIAAREEAQ